VEATERSISPAMIMKVIERDIIAFSIISLVSSEKLDALKK
jgi:hypothetical protein